MFYKNPLERVLGQASKVRILQFLVMTGFELNGREIAAAVGLSHVKAHTVLKELNQYDIVKMHRAGKSILYHLNLENMLVKKILIPLFEKEARLKNVLAEIILKYLKQASPKSIILFGSFASNRAKPSSDIDILIIALRKEDVPILEVGLKKAEASITIGFGNYLAPIVMDEAEFKRRFGKKDKLIMNIVKDGKVIFGETINELVRK